jgi:hypothetical protein
MPKVENIINYYINGELISSNKLKQPPDTLTADTLSKALGVVIGVNLKPNIKIRDALVSVTQGSKILLEHKINWDDEPP